MKATFDKDGLITGLYEDADAPKSAISITDTAYGKQINAHNPNGTGALQRWTGKKWVDHVSPSPSHTFSNGVWVLDFAAAQQLKAAQITKDFSYAVAQITSGYTEEEQKTWATQLAEAKAFTINNTAPTPALDAIIALSGEDKAVLTSTIIAKGEALAVASCGLLGKKRKLLADIAAATTQAALDAIVW